LSISFIFLAKGTSKLFFLNELTANIYILILNILGYHVWGLTGLGISFAIAYLLYLVQVFIISQSKFGFSFDRSFITIFIIQFSLGIGGFMTIHYLPQPYSQMVGTILIGLSGVYSIKELDKRLGLKSTWNTFKNKYIKTKNINE